MTKQSRFNRAFWYARTLSGLLLCGIAGLLAVASFAATMRNDKVHAGPAASPGATSEETGWSIVPSPNLSDVRTLNDFSGVTCVSSSDCWAVGSRLFDGYYRTLIQHWDGASWGVVPSPNSSDTLHNHLFGVSCASVNSCWAAGYTETQSSLHDTLLLRWNGASWTLATLPAPANSTNRFLTAVACASETDCWAVGASLNGDALNPATYDPLLARWNGASWTIVAPPNTGGNANAFLYGITCSSSTCWAVGYQGGSTWQTLILRWDGAIWTTIASPNSGATQDNYLFGVSCGSADACVAVGVYTDTERDIDRTFALRWDGTAWSVVDSPNGDETRHSGLYGVSCASAANCQAVGYGYFAGSGYWQTLILRWNGTAWTMVSSPNTSANEYNILYGIACLNGAECWAVGTFDPGDTQTLAQHWDGQAWTIVGSPNLTDKQRNQLFGVSCVNLANCWAVGVNRNFANDQTLIMHWNGISWTIVPSPNVGTNRKNVLTGVACASAADCWAVGQHTPGFNDQTLTLHWDGKAWTVIPSPNVSTTTPHDLYDVVCTSTANCWAVGEYLDPDFSLVTFAMRWNGNSWTIVSTPNAAGQRNVLKDIACVTAADCWAVGFTDTNSGNQTLVEHWNGSAWTLSPSANVPIRGNVLAGVACNSSTDCWAVGNYNNSFAEQTLIEHWDGSSWTITPSPNTLPASYNYLNDVSCASATECWAIGYAYTIGSPQTSILRWDGSSWTKIASPNTSTNHDNYLTRISCLNTFDCMAVGYYLTSQTGTAQTLALRYLDLPIQPVQLSGVVSRKHHGEAGEFDLILPLADSAPVECRSGGANGDYTIVFTFTADLSSVDDANITADCGSVAADRSGIGPNSNQYTATITGVVCPGSVAVTLANVNDVVGRHSDTVTSAMKILVGDTNGDGFVNSADIAQTKSQSGQAVTGSNFREDVTVEGNVNSADIALVKSKSGTALP